MNRRQFLFAAVFLSAMVLAFILRDVVEQLIIVPIIYLWWLLRLYYSIIPQFILWVILVAAVAFFALKNLAPEIGYRTAFKITHRPVKGEIEILVGWLDKSRRGGSYYKWLIANRLGADAREILAQRDGHAISKKFGPLKGRDWNPPQKIQDYLETGLNRSFADFPNPRWSLFKQNPTSTPLDLDPRQVIEYLENEMESSHDENRKSI